MTRGNGIATIACSPRRCVSVCARRHLSWFLSCICGLSTGMSSKGYLPKLLPTRWLPHQRLSRSWSRLRRVNGKSCNCCWKEFPIKRSQGVLFLATTREETCPEYLSETRRTYARPGDCQMARASQRRKCLNVFTALMWCGQGELCYCRSHLLA